MPSLPMILVVGNEPSVVEALRDNLRREFQVFATTSPREGLTTLRDREIHLVLADYRLSGTSGVAFLRQVRRDQPG